MAGCVRRILTSKKIEDRFSQYGGKFSGWASPCCAAPRRGTPSAYLPSVARVTGWHGVCLPPVRLGHPPLDARRMPRGGVWRGRCGYPSSHTPIPPCSPSPWHAGTPWRRPVRCPPHPPPPRASLDPGRTVCTTYQWVTADRYATECAPRNPLICLWHICHEFT